MWSELNVARGSPLIYRVMAMALKLLIGLLVAVWLGAFVFLSIFLQSVFSPIDIPAAARKFEIRQGETVKQISGRLQEDDLIKSDFLFRLYAWFSRKEKFFLAGNFDLPVQINTVELVSILTNEAKRKVETIKILEGWTVRDIAGYFENSSLWRQEEITRLVGLPGVDYGRSLDASYRDFSEDFPILKTKPAQFGLEGYLFPDTYEIFIEAGADGAIGKMLGNFEKKVDASLLDEIKSQKKNFYDVLIMASIIEAEVPHAQDRPIVSQVLWKRLNLGVPLQSDATLNYVLSDKTARLSLEQLKIDSPYNTYKYTGLPPTPIGNPGLESIKAAVYPAQTDYLYFLSTPAGQTIFSKTLQEHNQAKAKYFE